MKTSLDELEDFCKQYGLDSPCEELRREFFYVLDAYEASAKDLEEFIQKVRQQDGSLFVKSMLESYEQRLMVHKGHIEHGTKYYLKKKD